MKGLFCSFFVYIEEIACQLLKIVQAKVLTGRGKVCYIRLAMEVGLFFMPKIRKQVEVEVVRTRITLACTECKQRNYNTTKDKKTHPERMETKKYCKFCRSHTLHKETK